VIVAVATRRGTRDHNCDAAAIAASSGTTAAAVIDMIGNSAEIAQTGQILAEVAARVAARRGVLAGLLAAHEVIAAPTAVRTDPDGVAIVATARPGMPGMEIAWVGDAIAYGWDGYQLGICNTPWTVGQQMALNGAPRAVSDAYEDHVRTTISRATIGEIYERDVSDRILIIASDGAGGDHLSLDELLVLIADHETKSESTPQALAEAIVAATRADKDGYRDDATVVVMARTGGTV
jgi:protein phosphatase